MERGDKEKDKGMWFDRGKCHAPCFFSVPDLLTLFVATRLCLSVDKAHVWVGCQGFRKWCWCWEGRDGVVGRCPGLVSYFLHFFKEIDVGSRRV